MAPCQDGEFTDANKSDSKALTQPWIEAVGKIGKKQCYTRPFLPHGAVNFKKKQTCHWVYHIYVLLSDLVQHSKGGMPWKSASSSKLRQWTPLHGRSLPSSRAWNQAPMISQLHPIWAIHRVSKDREDHKTSQNMLNRANGSAASSVLPMTKRPEDIRHTIGKWLFKSPPNRKAIKSWGNVVLNPWMKWVRCNNFRTKSIVGENSLCKQYPNNPHVLLYYIKPRAKNWPYFFQGSLFASAIRSRSRPSLCLHEPATRLPTCADGILGIYVPGWILIGHLGMIHYNYGLSFLTIIHYIL